MSELDPDVMPSLFGHTQSVYKEMLAQATQVEAEGTSMIVYEGMLVNLITSTLNLSVPYYSKCMNTLKGMGCVRQLRRGGGTSKSQWELITEPTSDAFTAFMEGKPKPNRKQGKVEMLEQQVRNLTSRFNELEALVKGTS